MCQLLGMNCNTPTDIMFSFTGFATRAEAIDVQDLELDIDTDDDQPECIVDGRLWGVGNQVLTSSCSGCGPATGKQMRKHVPRPASLSTLIVPAWRWTISREIGKPRPVPLPSGLVVKKGSNIRRCPCRNFLGPSWRKMRLSSDNLRGGDFHRAA